MRFRYLIALAALSFVSNAMAVDLINPAMQSFATAGTAVNSKLVTTAIATACAAVTIQWILTYYKEIFNGEMSNSIAKGVGMITWFGATVALIKHQELLTNAYTGYLKLAGDVSGLNAADFTPGAVCEQGKRIITAVHAGFDLVSGNNSWAIADNFLSALVTFLVDGMVIIAFFTMALTLFTTNLEFYMMFAVAPLAFGLIPLSTFRDQGFAPIKGAISVGLRILILGIVIAVSKDLTDQMVGKLENLAASPGQPMLAVMWDFLAGMFGCALMAVMSGKIASSIASGSASFSGSDAIKAGAAMGAGMATMAGAGMMLGGGMAKTAKSAVSGLAGAAPALGKALGSMMPGPASLGVSPAGSSGGSVPGLGGSPIQERPSLESAAGGQSSGADASSAPPAGGSSAPASEGGASGNAQSAGIGGGGNGSTPETPKTPPGPSSWNKLTDSARKTADHHSQDNHSVGIQMHIGKD